MRLMATRWTRTAEDEPTNLICGARPRDVDEVALYVRRGQHPILSETGAREHVSSGSKDVSGARTVRADEGVKVATVSVPTRVSLKEGLVDVFTIVSLLMNLIVTLGIF